MTEHEFDNTKFYKGQILYITMATMNLHGQLTFKPVSLKLIAVDFEARVFTLKRDEEYGQFSCNEVDL